MSDTRTVEKAGVTFTVVRGRNDAFWDWYASPAWEPETVAAFERLLAPDTTYVDLGAWIGPTVLLAAGLAGKVVCFEPDPVARAELERNLALNPDLAAKVELRPELVAEHDGTGRLYVSEDGGDSLSSVVERPDHRRAIDVPTVGLGSFLASPTGRACGLLKVDVEGSEYRILPAARAQLLEARPALYLSLHPNFLFDKRSLATRIRSGLAVWQANRALLRTLAAYRHHYVHDEAGGGFRDVRRLDVLRAAVPFPLRSATLVGSYLFTDDPL